MGQVPTWRTAGDFPPLLDLKRFFMKLQALSAISLPCSANTSKSSNCGIMLLCFTLTCSSPVSDEGRDDDVRGVDVSDEGPWSRAGLAESLELSRASKRACGRWTELQSSFHCFPATNPKVHKP